MKLGGDRRHPLRSSLGLLVAVALAALVGCRRPSSRAHGYPPSGQWQGPSSATGNGAPSGPGMASGPSAPAPGGPTTDAQRVLDAHNRARAEHCAQPLVWSAEIASVAQRWADGLAQRGCRLEHSAGALGENLAAGSTEMMTPERAVDMWVEERARYDFGRGGFSMSTGHFTQVVWRESRRLGCGAARCSGVTVWVCNYDPPGNMEGDFQRNVGPATCRR